MEFISGNSDRQHLSNYVKKHILVRLRWHHIYSAIKSMFAKRQKGITMSKNYEDLTIKDSFMFGKICSKVENRKIILDALLQIDLHERKGDVEKQLQIFRDAKYSKLDLISEDESNKVYNAEMQNESYDKSRQKELPNRSRFYQSILDAAYFEAGKKYYNLLETFIIFICTFDPFDRGLPIYTLDTRCNEIELPEYNDNAHKIFFNTTADLSSLPQGTQNMLRYIETGIANDSATQAIDREIIEARLKEEWRAEYMLNLVHDTDVYREGADSRQPEIDELNKKLLEKDLLIHSKDTQLKALEEDIKLLKTQMATLMK